MFSLATRKINSNIFTSVTTPKSFLLSNRATLAFTQPQFVNDLVRLYNNSRGERSFGRNNRNSYGNDRDASAPRSSSYDNNKPRSRPIEELLDIFDVEAAPAQDNVDMTKYSEATVDIKGEDVPQPIQTFEDLGLDQSLAYNVKRCGFSYPVPVQKYSLSIINAGRDVMSCSQTGSGKTAAYLLPILNKLLQNPIRRERSRFSAPRAIILAPTRELAQQVHAEVLKFTAGTRLHSAVIFGGANPAGQSRALSNGADIIVATTGRFVDFRNQGLIRVNNVQHLVLDEADRMLDIGFGPQIEDIVNDPDMSAENRQTLLFSATFPKEIQTMAKNFLKPNYVMVTVGKIGSATETITQKFILTNEGDKLSQLKSLITKGDLGRTLIFAKTKRRVDEFFYTLQADGAKAASIHGDHSQGQRNYALRAFLQNQVNVLVATDVAARGLDIKNINTVINVDLPNTIDDYVHRIGRTGRAGNLGTSISMFTRGDDGLAKEMKEVLEEAKQEVPEWLHSMMPQSRSSFGQRSAFGGRNNYRGGNRGYGGNRGGNRGGYGGNRDGNRGGNRGGYGGNRGGNRAQEEF